MAGRNTSGAARPRRISHSHRSCAGFRLIKLHVGNDDDPVGSSLTANSNMPRLVGGDADSGPAQRRDDARFLNVVLVVVAIVMPTFCLRACVKIVLMYVLARDVVAASSI